MRDVHAELKTAGLDGAHRVRIPGFDDGGTPKIKTFHIKAHRAWGHRLNHVLQRVAFGIADFYMAGNDGKSEVWPNTAVAYANSKLEMITDLI